METHYELMTAELKEIRLELENLHREYHKTYTKWLPGLEEVKRSWLQALKKINRAADRGIHPQTLPFEKIDQQFNDWMQQHKERKAVAAQIMSEISLRVTWLYDVYYEAVRLRNCELLSQENHLKVLGQIRKIMRCSDGFLVYEVGPWEYLMRTAIAK